jgi:dihydroorotate dehydrogenase
LHVIALKRVQVLRRRLGNRIAIVGCGGIDDVPSAQAMFQAGADLVQLYTGLVFQGAALPGLLSREDVGSSWDQSPEHSVSDSTAGVFPLSFGK